MAFAVVLPISWAIFFVLTIFMGYRRHRALLSGEEGKLPLLELLFLFLGLGIGFWATNKIFDALYYELLLFNDWVQVIIPLFGSSIGAYFFFEIGHLITGKTSFRNLVRQPLVWISFVFFLLTLLSILTGSKWLWMIFSIGSN